MGFYISVRDSVRLTDLTLNKLLILPSYHGNERPVVPAASTYIPVYGCFGISNNNNLSASLKV